MISNFLVFLFYSLSTNLNIRSSVTAQPTETTKHTPTLQFDCGKSSEDGTYSSAVPKTTDRPIIIIVRKQAASLKVVILIFLG